MLKLTLYQARRILCTLLNPRSAASSALSSLRASSQAALSDLHVPTTRNEEYRFTDLSPLLSASLVAADSSKAAQGGGDADSLRGLVFDAAMDSCVGIVDGRISPELTRTGALPSGVYVGGASGAPAEAMAHLVRAPTTSARLGHCGVPTRHARKASMPPAMRWLVRMLFMLRAGGDGVLGCIGTLPFPPFSAPHNLCARGTHTHTSLPPTHPSPFAVTQLTGGAVLQQWRALCSAQRQSGRRCTGRVGPPAC